MGVRSTLLSRQAQKQRPDGSLEADTPGLSRCSKGAAPRRKQPYFFLAGRFVDFLRAVFFLVDRLAAFFLVARFLVAFFLVDFLAVDLLVVRFLVVRFLVDLLAVFFFAAFFFVAISVAPYRAFTFLCVFPQTPC